MSLAGVDDASVTGSDDASERDGALSARSAVSQSSSSAADEESLSALAAAILSRLSHDEAEDLPVRAHKSAAEKMHKMHQLLRVRSGGAGAQVDSETRTLLLFAGLRMQRRVALARSELAAADVERTRTLLFVLLALMGEEQSFGETELAKLEEFRASVLSGVLVPGDPRVPPKSGDVCRACLAVALCSDAKKLSIVADVFFRCSRESLAASLLGSGATGQRTLALSVVGALGDSEEKTGKLNGIVDLAESEAGQVSLRDLLLSFTLPLGLLGVRRCVQLSRDSSQEATGLHPPEMQLAHEVAMRGARWTYDEDPNPLHKACALLAGVVVHLGGGGTTNDVTRRRDAFAGRVDLPFLETREPSAHRRRLALTVASGTWSVYARDQTGEIRILFSGIGLAGLSDAVLVLLGGVSGLR